MNQDFISRFAPKLMMKRDGGSPSAGLNTEELVDAGGAARPYIAGPGDTREYFGDASAYVPRDQQPATQPAASTFGGMLLPGSQQLDSEPALRADHPAFARPSIGPQVRTARTPHPTAADMEATIMGGIQQGNINPMRGREGPMFRGTMPDPEIMTLDDMLQQFQIPSFLRTDELRGRRGSPPRGGETPVDAMADINAVNDPNAGLTRTRGGRSVYLTPAGFPNVSSPEGLAEFNQRMGVNLGNQVRTQAEQTALFRRGATPARTSRHTTGEAQDIPASQLGGLTGQAAVAEVRRRWTAAGYPANAYMQWESGHGRNQGTGPHVHIQPPRRRR